MNVSIDLQSGILSALEIAKPLKFNYILAHVCTKSQGGFLSCLVYVEI